MYYSERELVPLKNLVVALFHLENSRTLDDILQVVSHLIEWLAAPEQAMLRRAFTVWLNKVVLRQTLTWKKYIQHQYSTVLGANKFSGNC